jgi:hypothetical protein
MPPAVASATLLAPSALLVSSTSAASVTSAASSSPLERFNRGIATPLGMKTRGSAIDGQMMVKLMAKLMVKLMVK